MIFIYLNSKGLLKEIVCASTDKVWTTLVAGKIYIACISNGKDPVTTET
jgi:hypothetical protein